ncbi:methylated-DNA--[protein]-cysteine S-methyltransferase [Bifidobacterium eulemuris]|uniref:Methylated-DNA--protein-cysteine methyltransferase n=1 Tax=Bifidobacterium eulemuris TaxID=1765219 RepID=A0A261FZ38_9BIFI|nr:methylated-DNA--[protein]-cysteine S-methyltransferase [Bifidobacterium eulemuris]OZG64245.1 o-6-methylguanine DNA methyltransferase [Bifidobacterium eulemuris]QOL32828.1 methylated-DNA--[protein]-cysteine S-methyltransferase [Bifidobacterium eulemuris]
MQYICHYQSPLGDILLAADDIGVTGLWFDGQKYYAHNLATSVEEKETAALAEAKRWLDVYFSGKEPDFQPPIHFVGTPFQCEVWEILQTIPYGRTVTYGQIAQRLAEQRGLPHFSSQAVGGAVGHNHISVIVPCHRVVGADGSLTGYAGGVRRKVALLELEHADMDALYVPKKGTAL